MNKRRRLMPLVMSMLIGMAGSSARGQSTQAPPGDEDSALKELLQLMRTPVTVASNLVSDPNKQPVSITTVTRDQIQMSGVRTLNEVLTLYVPGFFEVEDQDDNIAAFRGIASDNNSKVMFLLNGHVMNTEWFWGPPDALLNGIDLDYIERIEVIRGPGSVTLGQGALLGVINVITRVGAQGGQTFSAGGGPEDAWQSAFDSTTDRDGIKTYAHLSVMNYGGQDLRAEGSATRDWEGLIGGKVYAAGNRNHRAHNLTGLVSLEAGDLKLDILHTDQSRDMYNFWRDRSQYTQILDSIAGGYLFHLAEGQTLEAKVSLAQDDYQLHSNLGYTMGGTREDRQSGTLTYRGRFGDLSFAGGVEGKRFLMGRRNASGNDFIVNDVGPNLLNSPNTNNHWVYPQDITTKGLFAEAFWTVGQGWDAFGALRYDTHPFWGSNLTPRLGVLYGPSAEWRFRLSYQTGFRGAPGVLYSGGFQGDGLLREDNFDKVYAATGGAVANLEKVRPEKSRSVELEGAWTPSDRLKVDAVIFHDRVDNIIAYGFFDATQVNPFPATIGTDQKGDWNGYWYYQNTKGAFTSQGLELSLHWHHRLVDLGFSHSIAQAAQVDSETHDSLYITPAAQGNHFKAYPEAVSRLNLIFFPGSDLSGSMNILSYGRWRSSGPEGEGQTVVNGAIRARVGPHAELVLSVTNLFDATRLYPYTVAPTATSSDPRAGSPSLLDRTWWLKASWRF